MSDTGAALASPPQLPLAAVVGQDDAKLALLLIAVDPRIGGVLLRGEKGTAKSTLARGLAALLPGSAPFVELPLGATEDRLVGSIDLAAALAGGGVQFRPGSVAAADGGVLYVDEINLLPDHLVDVLLDVAASGINRVEREGVSHVHASRFLLVGSMNPEEGDLRPQLLDRFGLAVGVRTARDPAERAAAVRRRLAFDADPAGALAAGEVAAAEADLRQPARAGPAGAGERRGDRAGVVVVRGHGGRGAPGRPDDLPGGRRPGGLGGPGRGVARRRAAGGPAGAGSPGPPRPAATGRNGRAAPAAGARRVRGRAGARARGARRAGHPRRASRRRERAPASLPPAKARPASLPPARPAPTRPAPDRVRGPTTRQSILKLESGAGRCPLSVTWGVPRPPPRSAVGRPPSPGGAGWWATGPRLGRWRR